MPLRIRRCPETNRPITVYEPPPQRDRPRPQGSMRRDPITGRRTVAPPAPEPSFWVGLDLGQAHDWSALVAVQRSETGFTVPVIERVRGLPYTALVARLVDFMDQPPLAGAAELVVDHTGVGRGVVDMIRAAGLAPIALTITGGSKVAGTRRAPKVPKIELVEGLLLAFQGRRIQIADQLAHAPALGRELTELRRKTTQAGHTQYGAWRDGEHDDLVLALAMAVWQADRHRPRAASTRAQVIDREEGGNRIDPVRQYLADVVR